MEVKFKKLHEKAVLPAYAMPGDAGLDLTATSVKMEGSKEGGAFYYVEYGTGIAVEIPEGYVGLIFPRSSISKTTLHLANSVGVIDSGYRGEISFRFKIDAFGSLILDEHHNLEKVFPAKYHVGDKVGQLIIVPYPTIKPILSEDLSETQRGQKGYGSTGV